MKSKRLLFLFVFSFFLILLITIFYYKGFLIQPKITSNEILENSISPKLEKSTINSTSEIKIINAEHLNENRNFISEIY